MLRRNGAPRPAFPPLLTRGSRVVVVQQPDRLGEDFVAVGQTGTVDSFDGDRARLKLDRDDSPVARFWLVDASLLAALGGESC